MFGFLTTLSIRTQPRMLLLETILLALLIQLIYGLSQLYNIIFHNNSSEIIRPTAGFLQVNIYSVTCVTGIIVSIYLLTHSKRIYIKLASLIYILITPAVILSTSSRSAIISLLISLIILILSKKTRTRIKKPLIILLAGTIISFPLLIHKNSIPEDKYYEFTKDNARKLIYEHTLWMIKEKPISGYGFDNFNRDFFYTYQDRNINNEYPLWIERLTHPHNEILFIAYGIGIVPVAFLTLILGLYALKLVSSKRKLTLFGIAAITPISLHSMLEMPLHSISLLLIINSSIIYIFLMKKRPLNATTNSNKIPEILILSFILITISLSIARDSVNISLRETEKIKNSMTTPSIRSISENIRISNIIFTINHDNSKENKAYIAKEILGYLNQYPSRNFAIFYVTLCNDNIDCNTIDVNRIIKAYKLTI